MACEENLEGYHCCHLCKECGEVMCDGCFRNVVKYPGARITDMQRRLKDNYRHWVHDVQADKEPNADWLVSWNNGFTRRDKTFVDLVANNTPSDTYAYAHTRNRYTADDKYRIKQNAEHGSSGSRGYNRRDDDNKRRRR